MPGTAWVDRGFDGMKPVASLRIAVDVTAVAKPIFIVRAFLIRVPQVKQYVRHGLAVARQDATLERDQMPIGLRVDEIPTFRRIRLEIRARGGGYRRPGLV